MTRSNRKRPRILIWAAVFGIDAASLPVLAQEAGDQVFTFGIRQQFGIDDNIRLDPSSAGATYYSDTALSFGVTTENGTDSFSFFAEGVGRIVDDPIIGTDSGFRDPKVDLFYMRNAANSRLSVFANYYKPDLAFQDPLQQDDIGSQDFYRGGGTREEFYGGIFLETGLQSPLGFVIDINSRRNSYSDVTDPLLYSNETHYAGLGVNFRLSNVARGRIDVSEKYYRAENASSTNTDTRRLTFGLDYDISATDRLSVDLGHSKVVETFDALPGVENNLNGPVGEIFYRRLMPDGVATASLDTTLTSRGRETTLEFGRVYERPSGRFEFSLGAAAGEDFDARPIGLLAYSTETARSAFDVSLSRTASIDDELNQATETNRFSMGYRVDVTNVSAISFDLYLADINLVGIGTSGAGRSRGSLYASYIHDLTQDWNMVVGYQYKYFDPDSGASSKSNGVFLTLERDFETLR
ncbi:hypothetical protein [uncultured Shimia sp.]|uniref:hypothetical protein n=1 Tax=uncultured Shimia sp. TaxID=573152 RepID=UPI00261F3E49|nr:hypothetical protein [uncultured Shimia sp.]